MAIYTQYGRYLKAKQFKNELDIAGDTYMVFGLGNPQWDKDSDNQGIKVAPYNLEVATDNTSQFYDLGMHQYFQQPDVDSSGAMSVTTSCSVENSIPSGYGDDSEWIGSPSSLYMHKCRRLIPPFPCTWIYDDSDKDILIVGDGDESVTVKQSDYQDYYITRESETNDFLLSKSGESDTKAATQPADTDIAIQYFTEMYLRGKALQNGITAPVGLIGAVKCNVDFVKDIGGESDNTYTGNIDQFWYGDRYWQIVRPHDDEDGYTIDDYIHDDDISAKSKLYNNQTVYPHHLIITATVNPRVLCAELSIDRYLVPRHIGIFTRKRTTDEPGPLYYRADEYIFNFGQYVKNGDAWSPSVPSALEDKMLNFTLPCDLHVKATSESSAVNYQTPKGEFEFLLNDYIRGQIRELHSIDRFGYVIGF